MKREPTDDTWFGGEDWRDGRMSRPKRSSSASLDAALPYPHYSDERWNTAQLVWGSECRTDECNYSDRLWEWDWAAGERAGKACEDAGLKSRTARQVETWLSAYHGKPVTLRYVMAGCNLATGYAYYVYGYDYADQAPA